jgi:hypothetical protein
LREATFRNKEGFSSREENPSSALITLEKPLFVLFRPAFRQIRRHGAS